MTARPGIILEAGPIEGQFAEDRNKRSGLIFVVRPGIIVDGIIVSNIPETSLTLTDNATLTVYIKTSTNVVTFVAAGGEPGTSFIPIFSVTTVAGVITTVTDNRKVITNAIIT